LPTKGNTNPSYPKLHRKYFYHLSAISINIIVFIQISNTTLWDQVCQRIVAGRWFSLFSPVSSTNKTERYDKPEILLKVALKTITLTSNPIQISVKWENVGDEKCNGVLVMNKNKVCIYPHPWCNPIEITFYRLQLTHILIWQPSMAIWDNAMIKFLIYFNPQ